MKPTITKQSDTEIKRSTVVEEIVSVSTLSDAVKAAQESLDTFEAWVLSERAARQNILDTATSDLNQASSLGIEVSMVANQANETPL